MSISNLKVKPGDGKATYSWTNSAQADNAIIAKAGKAGQSWRDAKSIEVVATATGCVIEGLENGVEYIPQVTQVEFLPGGMNGAPFTPQAVAPTPAPPPPPTPAPAPQPPAPAPAPAVGPFTRPFPDNDPFNTLIIPGHPVDPQSPAWELMLKPYEPSVNLTDTLAWGIPVYVAQDSDPEYTIHPSVYRTQFPWTFKLPKATQANTGGDHHLIVLEQKNGKWIETDFWEFGRNADGSPFASSMWQFDLSLPTMGQGRDGIIDGANAVHLPLMAGLVRGWEVRAGKIDHALSITPAMITAPGVFRAPAQATDGKTVGGIPEGARLQLDPSLDTAAISNKYERMFAETFQEKGAIITDTGGSLAIFAESPATANYPSDFTGNEIKALPWDRVRILA